MRWFVEVTSLGNAQKESLHVDADTWQGALQTARLQRGDTGAISGFSINILDDGCRAVDPASQALYEVRKVAGGTPSPPTSAPSAHPKAPQRATSTVPLRPPPPAPIHPRQSSVPPPGAEAVAAPTMTAEAPSPPRASATSSVLAQVVFRREQERTPAVPLTYRECVYLVPEGTSEADAEALLVNQLAQVRASLERLPAGRLVNLAVFDPTAHDKPGGLPIATLTWKDWRNHPAVAFPRRLQRASRSEPAPPATGPVAIAGPAAPIPGPAASIPGPMAPIRGRVASTPGPVAPITRPMAPTPGPVAPIPGPVAPIPGPVAPIPGPMAPIPGPMAPMAGAAPANPGPRAPTLANVGSATPVVPAASPPVGGAPGTPAFPSSTPAPGPTSRRGSSPRVRPVGARVHGEELIADLFEAMHDLHFLPDAIEGGEFCLTLGMQEIPSQIGIIHLYDIDHREFVVSNARGAGAPALLLRRHAETDPMLAAAMRGRRAVVIADADRSDAATLDRYVAVGGARSVIVAPAMQAGRFLGAIELLNPLDGQPFTESDGNAVLYIAEQFAEFVAARGVVTDPDRIAARRSR